MTSRLAGSILGLEGTQPQQRPDGRQRGPNRHLTAAHGNRSTGVERKSDEPVGQTPGELVETVAGAAGMAADLPVVEQRRERIGQHPDHRRHGQSGALVDSGMLEMAIGGDGLKHLGIDAPSTAAELLDKRWRDGAEFEIGGVEGSMSRRAPRLRMSRPRAWSSGSPGMFLSDSNNRVRIGPGQAIFEICKNARSGAPWRSCYG